jgi:surface protein with Ig-like domain/Kelch motif protein/galactose oxidase-like protein
LLLPSGKVLVAGGGESGSNVDTAELYDPATGTWSSAGTLTTARTFVKLFLLSSGKVLLFGGSDLNGPKQSAELYDPATNTWSPTGSLSVGHMSGAAVQLPSGKVLVVGGYNSIYYLPVTTTEIYDPATGQWSTTAPASMARVEQAALVLGSGKVLVTGGHGSNAIDLPATEWYDESTGSWHAADRMVQSRSVPTAVLLASGQVLMLGGNSGGGSVGSAELYSETPPPQACDALPPVLTLNGSADMTLECQIGGTYSDPGAQAVDGCGHAIAVHAYNTGADSSGPGPLVSYEGNYTVSYSAWDTAGQTVNASRTVHVVDRTAPTLTLKGPAHMVHTCNNPWVDPGVDAIDACYGNISSWAWHSGEVNGWAAGTYTVTYSVTDSRGNSAVPVTRIVDVVNCPW